MVAAIMPARGGFAAQPLTILANFENHIVARNAALGGQRQQPARPARDCAMIGKITSKIA